MKADDRPDSDGPHVQAHYHPPKPKFIGRREFRNFDLAEIAALHRLAAVLPDLGSARRVSGDPERRGRRRIGAARVLRRQVDAQARDRRALADRERGDLLPAGEHDQRRRHRDLHRREPHDGRDRLAQPAPADAEARGRRRTSACPISSRRNSSTAGRRASPTTSACSRSRPVLASRSKEKEFVDAARRLFVDHAQGDRRPPRRGVRRVPARAGAHGPLGLRSRTRRCTTKR